MASACRPSHPGCKNLCPKNAPSRREAMPQLGSYVLLIVGTSQLSELSSLQTSCGTFASLLHTCNGMISRRSMEVVRPLFYFACFSTSRPLRDRTTWHWRTRSDQSIRRQACTLRIVLRTLSETLGREIVPGLRSFFKGSPGPST